MIRVADVAFEILLDEKDGRIYEIILKLSSLGMNKKDKTVLVGDHGVVDLNFGQDAKCAKVVKSAKRIAEKRILRIEHKDKIRCKYVIDKLILPRGLEEICDGAFRDGGFEVEIKNVVWPDKCHTIPSRCFANTYICGLSNINHVSCIQEEAFALSQITSIKWPSKCDYIPKAAFIGSHICSITNIGHVKSIGENAFDKCTELKNFTIPKDVKVIPMGCFSASGLTRLRSYDNIEEIGDFAFYECHFQSFVWPSKCKIVPDGCFADMRDLKKVTNLEGVTDIGNSAFFYTSINRLVFSEKLTRIGESAFEGSTLYIISGTENVETIGCRAFAQSSIEEFDWPPKCQTINSEMFCSSCLCVLKNLQNVISIGKRAFFDSNIIRLDLSESMCVDIHEKAFDGINPERIELGYYSRKNTTT